MVLILLLLTSASVVCSTAFAEGHDSLQLALAVDAEAYCLGQPVFMVVTLKNTGARPVRARLGNTLKNDFDLEMALGKEPFAPVDFRLVANMRLETAFRDFKPAEILGASTAVMLKGGGKAPPLRMLKGNKVDLSRWLLFGQPGSYRLRAALNITLKDRAFRVHSKEISIKVTPAAKGYEHFLRFTIKHCRNESLRLDTKAGFAAAQQLLPRLEKTVYAQYVNWMMLRYHRAYRMTDDQKEKNLSDEEKAQRARFKKYAEGVVVLRPKTWTLREEEVLAWLILYHVQENELAKARRQADVLRKNLPWSRYADVAGRLERATSRSRTHRRTSTTRRGG